MAKCAGCQAEFDPQKANTIMCAACRKAAAEWFWRIVDNSENDQEVCPVIWQPVPGGIVSCGNRQDIPRKQRVHKWQDHGIDIRHQFDGSFVPCQIRICQRCGRDDQRRIDR